MSGSREHVLYYSGPLLHKETQLVAQPVATSGLCSASEDKRGHRPPAPTYLLSHWSKSGPGGPDSSVPAGVPRAFQTFQVKPHGTLWTTALHSCPESGGISLRGSIVGGRRLLELLSPPAVTWGSFQMPALTLGAGEGQEHLRC